MTSPTQSQVLDEVIDLMKGLSGEWEYSGPVAPETRLFADMELKSLDFAVLSAGVVRKYGRLPFDVFYADLTSRPPEQREVTVREYVDFVCEHLPNVRK